MEIDSIENALSGINEKTIDSISKERFKKMKNDHSKARTAKAFGSSKKLIAAAAAALLLCSLAVIIPLSQRNPGVVSDPNGSESADPRHTGNTEGIPQYIPEYGAPTLDEVYATAPYSELLPKRLLSDCSFVSSYMIKYDPVANPDDHKFLALVFKTGNETWSRMEIKVSEYDKTTPFADINDQKTYALSYLYGENAGPAGDLQGFSELFHSEDITKDIVKEMVYTASDGLCKAEISVLCGDYIVSYAYTGPEITSDAFYDMIVSSDYLEK